ncbi:tyrosine-protein phosphatase [Dactylosporangium sp. CA-092794]|uniref:tyrosine-protein phosphatase n=1 Tax=Dactylosporangium sp. CA-092794 TaxID=3239929 RepID=UPI003D9324D5
MLSMDRYRLHWPDCRNVRDLGGLPTADGGTVRERALVRSDSPHRLTAEGLAALRAHGVRRVIDLRGTAEAAALPSVLSGEELYRLMPFVDEVNDPARDLPDLAPIADVYKASIIGNAPHIAAAVGAVADAPAGAVLVHCAAGQDRTGLLVAVLLRLAGVADEVIAADYAYSAVCWERPGECEPATIRAALARIDEAYDDVPDYLLAHGVTTAQLQAVRDRLRTAT